MHPESRSWSCIQRGKTRRGLENENSWERRRRREGRSVMWGLPSPEGIASVWRSTWELVRERCWAWVSSLQDGEEDSQLAMTAQFFGRKACGWVSGEESSKWRGGSRSSKSRHGGRWEELQEQSCAKLVTWASSDYSYTFCCLRDRWRWTWGWSVRRIWRRWSWRKPGWSVWREDQSNTSGRSWRMECGLESIQTNATRMNARRNPGCTIARHDGKSDPDPRGLLQWGHRANTSKEVWNWRGFTSYLFDGSNCRKILLSLRGVGKAQELGRWSACGRSVVQLDHNERFAMHGIFGELEIQRTINRAELISFVSSEGFLALSQFMSTMKVTLVGFGAKKQSGLGQDCRCVGSDLGGGAQNPSRRV